MIGNVILHACTIAALDAFWRVYGQYQGMASVHLVDTMPVVGGVHRTRREMADKFSF